MKIVTVVGARPNLMKIAPLIEQMRGAPDIDPVLVHTGQHYDDSLSAIFFQELGIPEPDYNLGVGSGTHAEQVARVMLGLEPLLERLGPELVVVVGDVNSTLAAALVAAKLRIPLAHVEAGLRSFDRAMPEETNRVLTDAVADYLFTTERSAVENLRREGIPDSRIFFVGNVMIDTLLRHRERARSLAVPARFGLAGRDYALVTLHRPSNVDRPAVLEGVVEALAEIQATLPVLFPAHPRTLCRLRDSGLQRRVRQLPDLRLIEPLSYLDFLGLMAEARVVLTDSGGIQEETTILGVPCLTLRENTERPVTVREGSNRIVGSERQSIVDAVGRVLVRPAEPRPAPELWDGSAAQRIIAVLRARG
jgi:UDP-N-acetylglucosamine 2-epimerase (non-hydrolysing)